jgi:hypothetical protein
LLLSVSLLVSLGAQPANALLIDLGGGMIYDTDYDLTWLQDADYSRTSGFDADGFMTWNEAMDWASGLVYGGLDDWRLPSAFDLDGSGPCFGLNCIESEMGHLFYTELGNTALSYPTNSGPFLNIGPVGLTGIEPGYWTSTEYSAAEAWQFHFNNFLVNGQQDVHFKSTDVGGQIELPGLAWAVRSGRATAEIPEPATPHLLLSGLLALGSLRLRRRTF